MASPISSGVLSAAADETNYLTNKVVDQQFNRADQRFSSKLNEKSFQRNSDYSYGLNRKALLESPLLNVEGLRSAGINPAFQHGEATALAPASAPAGNQAPPAYSAKSANPMFISELMRSNAEIGVLKSEKNKNDALTAEADSRTGMNNIEVQRMENEDTMTDIQMRNYFTNLADEAEKAGNDKTAATLRKIVAAAGYFSVGARNALGSFDEVQTALSNNDVQRRFRNKLESAVLKEQLTSKETVRKLAHLPDEQFNLLIAETAHYQADIELLMTKKDLTKEQIDEVVQSIQESKQRVRKMIDEDVAELFERGEFQRILVQEGQTLLHKGEDLGAEVIKARTFTGGMTKAAAAKKPAQIHNTTNTHNESKYYKGSSPEQHYGKHVHIENHQPVNEYGAR